MAEKESGGFRELTHGALCLRMSKGMYVYIRLHLGVFQRADMLGRWRVEAAFRS